MQSFLHQKIVTPFLNLLKEGITPQKLAQSVTLGIVMGFIPIWGISTSLCVALGLKFRLNMVAIQTANYLVAPLQLLVFIPFIHLGNFFTQSASFPYTAEQVLLEIQQAPEVMFLEFGWAITQGVLAWALVMLPLSLILYRCLFFIFQKFKS